MLTVITACTLIGTLAPTPESEHAAFARRVKETLESATYLRVNARVVHQGREILVRCDMAADRLRVEAFRDGTLISACAIRGDRVQEYVPLHVPSEHDLEYRNVVVEFDKLDIVAGSVSVGSNMLLDSDTACEFGTLTLSWLDPSTERASMWSDRVLEGAQQEDQIVDGKRCLVFRQSLVLPGDEGRGEFTIATTTWFDAASALPVRWDTTQSTSEYSIHRERHYTIIRAERVPDDVSWTLDPGSLKGSLPPTLGESREPQPLEN